MTTEDLLQEQAQMQASMAAWKQTIAECNKIIRECTAKRLAAERQLDVHAGHLERINIWLAKTAAGSTSSPAEPLAVLDG